jgi:peroxiredoxin
MGLRQELAAYRAEFMRTAPAGRQALYQTKIDELRAEFAVEKAVGEGDEAPGFTLPNALGKLVSLAELRRQGPVVLIFYRGGWCPYCNIQLGAYQRVLGDIETLGARLVAISPQLPDQSLSTAEKNELRFDVLSDVGNKAASNYGLVYALPEELRAALSSNNKALPGINGDESWQLPVPATYVINKAGRVSFASIDVDYRNRADPEAVLTVLRSLASK